jgi:hypothetical protein
MGISLSAGRVADVGASVQTAAAASSQDALRQIAHPRHQRACRVVVKQVEGTGAEGPVARRIDNTGSVAGKVTAASKSAQCTGRFGLCGRYDMEARYALIFCNRESGGRSVFVKCK